MLVELQSFLQKMGLESLSENDARSFHGGKMRVKFFLITALVLLFTGAAFAQSATCSRMSTGAGASINGFVPFPASGLCTTDISSAAVDLNSASINNFIGSTVTLHPDFAAGTYKRQTIGIPYQVVAGTQAKVTISLGAYASESEPGPMPIPSHALIEVYPKPGNGDRHVLVLEKDGCWLYELYHATLNNNGSWSADSAAAWDMTINEQRPYTWTSADAAGLPIFPGLARYDEVAAGKVSHALRFTLQNSRAAFIPPASHWAANSSDSNAAPMGMRRPLTASFDVSGYSTANQVILNALKKYGMIMPDNGSNMYLSGAPDDRWDNTDLHALGQVKASDFEVLQMTPRYTQSNVPTGASPQITSFAASSTSVSAGTPVTLSWHVNGVSYIIVSPQVGAVRSTSVVVTPAQTTTYTLYATNAFGQTMSTVTVTVH